MRAIVRRATSPRGFASLSGVLALVVAGLAVTLGSAGRARLINLLAGHGWVANDTNGQVLLANGTTGRVDLKLQVKGAGGHRLDVVQAGRTAILVDRSNGEIGSIDLNSFRVVNVADGGPASGLDVEASPTTVYVIHEAEGTIDARDPLADRIIDSITLAAPLSNGVVDSNGALWVVSRHDGALASFTVSGGHLHPSVHGRVVEPGSAVQLTLADGAPAVLDQSQDTFVRAPGGHASTVLRLPLDPGQTPVLANVVDGPVVPVAVNNAGSLLLLSGASETAATLPGRAGHDLAGPVAFGDRIYVPDYTSGDVAVLDDQGQAVRPGIPVRAGRGAFEVYSQNGFLWINDPTGATSWSVDSGGGVHSIDKGTGDVPSNVAPQPTPLVATRAPAPSALSAASVVTAAPGGSPPAVTPVFAGSGPLSAVAPAQPVPPPPSPATPTVPPSAPAAPGALSALAGNGQVSLSWAAADPHGSAVTAYNVSWGGGSLMVAGSQTTQTVTGLTNGTTYTFTVSATNAYGTGPSATSNPVTPSSAMPGAPAGLTATASPNGSITVSWQAANGQGHQITGYTIFATDETAGAGPRSVGTAILTSDTVPASALVPGHRYVFTVSSTNDAGGSSQPSPPSSAVTDYVRAGPPIGLRATGKDGQVDLSWNAPSSLGGGNLVDYVVAVAGAGSQRATSTSTTVTGLRNGISYTFKVAAETVANVQTVTGASATASATPTAPPSATVTRGVPYTGGGTSGSCVGTYCYWFAVTLQNFSPKTTYSVQCWSNFNGTNSFATFPMKTDASGSGHVDGTNYDSCFFGNRGAQVWVVVTPGNVTSRRFTW